MKKVIGILMLVLLPHSWAMHLDVAMAMDDYRLTRALAQWIDKAKHVPVFEKYGFQWFVGHYPLHVTLYMSEFPKEHYPFVKQSAQHLAQEAEALCISTGALSLTASGWIMMDVERDDALQCLSDKAVLKLSAYRDKQASIPPWATSIPGKVKAFARYGSPNVFFEFDPHMSISGPPTQEIEKDDRLRMEHYLAEHPFLRNVGLSEPLFWGRSTTWGKLRKN